MLSLDELYAISLIERVGDQTLRKIISSGKTLPELLQLGNPGLRAMFSNEKSIEAFKGSFSLLQEKAGYELDDLRKKDISLVHYHDENYPVFYRLLDDYPVFLYCRGNRELL